MSVALQVGARKKINVLYLRHLFQRGLVAHANQCVYEGGVENAVCFLTAGISAQQLEELASLMDECHRKLVHVY